jgi:hypothetical protein
MKKLFLLVAFCLNAGLHHGQNVPLSSVFIQHEPGSLLVSNSDTSYLFHAYVLTQDLNGIDTVALACQNFSANAWVPASDTSYTWSLVLADSLAGPTSYGVCKPNDNLLHICLGRLYFSTRHRFIFTLSGTNGILTKEFTF